MTWMTMCDGYEMSLAYPKQHELCFKRLAHNISQINRFNGACVRPYSVAEHSLLVLEIAEKHLQLDVFGLFAALNHDLHEGITGDQTTPTKRQVGPAWDAFEVRFEHLVGNELHMLTARVANHEAIQKADRMALAMEREQLLPKIQPNGNPSTPWPMLARVTAPTDVDLMHPMRTRMTWDDWREAFIERFVELDTARRLHVPATQEAA